MERGGAGDVNDKKNYEGRNIQISTTHVAPITEEEDQLALEQRLYEESLKVLDEGQVLTGTIVQRDKDEVLVDVGGKSEGVLPFRELSLAIDSKLLKVGDTIEVMVHRIDEMDGTLFFPSAELARLRRGRRLSKRTNRDEVIEATVTQVVKGGVLVDLGMRGFVPRLADPPSARRKSRRAGQSAPSAESDRPRSQTPSRRSFAAARS